MMARKLDWESNGTGAKVAHVSEFQIAYFVTKESDGVYSAEYDPEYHNEAQEERIGDYGTEQEAIAACQADFDKRVEVCMGWKVLPLHKVSYALDGDLWEATLPHHTNLMEAPTGFGETQEIAAHNLRQAVFAEAMLRGVQRHDGTEPTILGLRLTDDKTKSPQYVAARWLTSEDDTRPRVFGYGDTIDLAIENLKAKEKSDARS
jgi:hypothetical protein